MMKKWLFLIGLVIVLVACSNNNAANTENNTNNNEVENEENNVEIEENNGENNNVEINNSNDENNGDVEDEVDNQNANDQNSDEEKSTEEILQEKVYEIFAAQREHDYEYLTSVLSEGSELDQENNMFTFNDVTYPHDQEFLDEIAEDDLEFRYTHEEDDGTIIVGFAAIDYENESSFVIDFQFILENDEWKMKDMDVNK